MTYINLNGVALVWL